MNLSRDLTRSHAISRDLTRSYARMSRDVPHAFFSRDLLRVPHAISHMYLPRSPRDLPPSTIVSPCVTLVRGTSCVLTTCNVGACACSDAQANAVASIGRSEYEKQSEIAEVREALTAHARMIYSIFDFYASLGSSSDCNSIGFNAYKQFVTDAYVHTSSEEARRPVSRMHLSDACISADMRLNHMCM